MEASNQSKKFPARRIVLNSAACGGCMTCERICSARHFHECRGDLSAIHIHADFYEDTFTLFNCRQCAKAACKDACPTGAIQFDEERRAFYINKDTCIGCGACTEACPFKGKLWPYINEAVCDGEGYIVKCDLCHGFEDGPACVKHCPKGALTIK